MKETGPNVEQRTALFKRRGRGRGEVEHAWCKDVARDAAVRAAEDGRNRPLPTLEQCIEQAKQAAMAAGVKEAFIQSDTGWVPLTREHLRRLEQMIPKSVSASSPVEQENKGDGMRTERVTLEVTHDLDARLSDWLVEVVEESLGLMESVRVVEDGVHGWKDMAASLSTDVLKLTAERDAAIRERDRWCAQSVVHERAANAAQARVAEMEAQLKILDDGQPTAPSDLGIWGTAKELSARCQELAARLVCVSTRATAAEARVADLEAASGGGEREGDVASLRADVAKLENDKQFLVERLRPLNDAIPAAFDDNGDRMSSLAALRVLIDERDAAIRERDEAIAESERRLRLCETMKRDGDSARFHAAVAQARVAELEAASGGNHSPDAGKMVEQEPVACKNCEGAETVWCEHSQQHIGCYCARDTVREDEGQSRVIEVWHESSDPAQAHRARAARLLAKRDAAQARAAELEAASGGGEQEPYMVTASGIPLYRSPPQPRGWLTGEEREAVETARDHFDDDDHGDSECVFIARMLKQILARSTPPEVVLPMDEIVWNEEGRRVRRLNPIKVREALTSQGVLFKEAT